MNLAPYLKTKTETSYEVALKSSSDKAYMIVWARREFKITQFTGSFARWGAWNPEDGFPYYIPTLLCFLQAGHSSSWYPSVTCVRAWGSEN